MYLTAPVPDCVLNEPIFPHGLLPHVQSLKMYPQLLDDLQASSCMVHARIVLSNIVVLDLNVLSLMVSSLDLLTALFNWTRA